MKDHVSISVNDLKVMKLSMRRMHRIERKARALLAEFQSPIEATSPTAMVPVRAVVLAELAKAIAS